MAAKKIASLFIGVSAGTGNTEKVFKKVAGGAGNFGNRLRAIGSKSGPSFTDAITKIKGTLPSVSSAMIGVAGATATLGTAFYTVNRALQKTLDRFAGLGATGKTADKLGMMTESLAGLQHAADLSGAGDKLQAGLTTMVKRVGEAVRGKGAAIPALKMLGLDAKNLAQAGTTRAFMRIADSVSQIRSPMLRASVTADIFSKQNMALVNTLAMGSAGLRKAGAEAMRYGQSFGRAQHAGVEIASDAMANYHKVLDGVWKKLAVALAPAAAATFRTMTVGVSNAIPPVERLEQSFNQTAISIGKTARWLGVAVGKLRAFSYTVSEMWLKFSPAGWATQAWGGSGTLDILQQQRKQHDQWVKGMERWRPGRDIQHNLRQVYAERYQMTAAAAARRRSRMMPFIGDSSSANTPSVPVATKDPRQEAVQKAVERQREAAASALRERTAAADQIRESIKTPLQQAQEKIAKIRTLWKSGDLSWKTADTAIRKERLAYAERAMAAAGKGGTKQYQPVAATAGGSQGFASALAQAWNRRKNPEVTELQHVAREIKGLRRDLTRGKTTKYLNLAGT